MEQIKEKFEKGYSVKQLSEEYKKDIEDIHKIIGIKNPRDSKYYRMCRDLNTKGYNNFSEFMIDVGIKKAKNYANKFN